MSAPSWVLAAVLVLGIPVRAQGLTANERLVQLAEVLGQESPSGPAAKIRAIREIGAMGVVSGLAAGLLFDRANLRFETDPLVREAAAQALKFVVETRNRMGALRLARFTFPASEPDARVRIAALGSLAAFESAEAANCIYDSTAEAKEPDPTVREAAKALIRKGLASSLY
jgi:hypothetical protein